MSILGAAAMVGMRNRGGDFIFNLASNTINTNLRNEAISAGWDGSAPVIAIIDTIVSVMAPVTSSNPMVVVDGTFPGGLRINITESGAVYGLGGVGGGSYSGNGQAGRTAFKISTQCEIDNLGTMAGGGGGGGGPNDQWGGGGGGAPYGWGGGAPGYTGGNGTLTTGGSGSRGGGKGGNLGLAGSIGLGTGSAGVAGFYVDGNSYVTWINTGTRLGRVQ